jgi:hypothetical protein
MEYHYEAPKDDDGRTISSSMVEMPITKFQSTSGYSMLRQQFFESSPSLHVMAEVHKSAVMNNNWRLQNLQQHIKYNRQLLFIITS